MATADFDIVSELSNVCRKAVDSCHPREMLLDADEPRILAARQGLEDLLSLLTITLLQIDKIRERWSESVSKNVAPFEWKHSGAISDIYRGWLEISTKLLQELGPFETEYSEVPGAIEFRNSYRRVKLMSLDTDRTKRSIESLQAGEGVPFDRAMDVLRDTLR